MIFHLSFHYKKMNRVEIFMNGGSYMRMYLDLENKQCLTIVSKLIINLEGVMFLPFYLLLMAGLTSVVYSILQIQLTFIKSLF